MFVQSEKFVEEHQGRINEISIYGQESNQTTLRLAKMNLAIRGIDSSQVKWKDIKTALAFVNTNIFAHVCEVSSLYQISIYRMINLEHDSNWVRIRH